MRHLFIVEVDADDSIPAETVDTLFTVSTLANHIRAIANKCKTDDPEKPRQTDIRDLNIGLVKIVCSFKPIDPKN